MRTEPGSACEQRKGTEETSRALTRAGQGWGVGASRRQLMKKKGGREASEEVRSWPRGRSPHRFSGKESRVWAQPVQGRFPVWSLLTCRLRSRKLGARGQRRTRQHTTATQGSSFSPLPEKELGAGRSQQQVGFRLVTEKDFHPGGGKSCYLVVTMCVLEQNCLGSNPRPYRFLLV